MTRRPLPSEQTAAYGTADCRRFRAAIFGRHCAVREELAAGFLERAGAERDPLDGNRVGNDWLRGVDAAMRLGEQQVTASDDDDVVRQRAEVLARECERLYMSASVHGVAVGSARAAQQRRPLDFYAVAELVRQRVEGEGIEWPADIRKRDSAEQIREKIAGAVARAGCPQWWRRRLRVQAGRAMERVMRDAGAVRRQRSPYVSDWAFKRWKTAQKRNAETLANMDAIADDGTIVPLTECVAASVANPENRRNELMVRMRGWEEVAAALGLQGAMLTLTAPGKYHARLSQSGAINPKYNGADPIRVMAYLNGVWACIRAEWARQGIKTLGFRIAEPHHDGTPHFHFLLFFNPGEVQRARAIFAEYAMAEDGSEPGADKHRWDWKAIDPAKGTAAGYVAKYVAKNVDGYGIGGDDEGEVLASEGAGRARAWASLWGIRQFQQIGAVSVTVYRELRRLQEPLSAFEPQEIKDLRDAADAGDWALFVELMGGAFVERNAQTLRPLLTKAPGTGRYGDKIQKIIGLCLGRILKGYTDEFMASYRLQTREKEWRIVQRVGGSGFGGGAPPPLGLVSITVRDFDLMAAGGMR